MFLLSSHFKARLYGKIHLHFNIEFSLYLNYTFLIRDSLKQ